MFGNLQDKAGDLLVKAMDVPFPPGVSKLSGEDRDTIKSLLKPGDVLLETDNAYPGWQIAEKYAFGSNWTHAGLYVGNGTVIDSGTIYKVSEVPIDKFLDTYHIGVFRPHYQSREDVKSAIDYVHAQLGKPYDDDFGDLPEDGKYYCAKLVYYALLHMPHPIAAPLVHFLGKEIVSPDSFSKTPEIDKIWSSNPSFVKNMACHWPTALGATLGGAAGSPFGAVGITAGAILGASIVAKALNAWQGNS